MGYLPHRRAGMKLLGWLPMNAPFAVHIESVTPLICQLPNGSVSREKVYARTTELAILAGRHALEIRKCDYDRAKQEITGTSDPQQQLLILC